MNKYSLSFRYIKTAFILFAFSIFIFSCSTLDKLSKGRLDRLKKPPFYKSYQKVQLNSTDRIFHLPVDVSRESVFDLSYEDRKMSLRPLLEALNDYVDSLNLSQPFQDPSALPAKGEPYVYVGSSEGENAPPGSETLRTDTDKYPPMMIYAEKPSEEWQQVFTRMLQNTGGQYLLIIDLSFVQYPKADRGLFNKKVVLGTDYEQNINFFSAEDKPVEVLQVTGMILNQQGKIIRAGAEGILAKDTPFFLQVLDIQKDIDNQAIRKLLEDERREELPGKPLKWKVAVGNLMKHLLERQ